MEESGAFHNLAQDSRKFLVSDSVGCNGIQGTLDGGISKGVKEKSNNIGNMDPGHPLASGAELAAQPASEKRTN